MVDTQRGDDRDLYFFPKEGKQKNNKQFTLFKKLSRNMKVRSKLRIPEVNFFVICCHFVIIKTNQVSSKYCIEQEKGLYKADISVMYLG